LGLLPNSQSGEARLVSLIRNSQGHFTNKWVKLRTTPSRENLFFNKLNEIELPIRHGEGRLALEISGESMDKAANLVKERAPLRYVDEVNGSFDKIAALSNAQGNVLGLMPHPEAFVRWTQNPNWTSRKLEMKIHSGTTDPQHMPHGLAILRNAALSLN
jgi:phosphoribosylformylglycinamidine synthase